MKRDPLFSVGGVGVTVDPSWFIIFALVVASLAIGYVPSVHPGHARVVYWSVATIVALLFFGSVLTHELAHAWVSNHLGLEVKTITLFIFGGVAHLSAEPKEPGADLKIAVAGPATSFGLGVGFFALGWLAGRLGAPGIVTGAAEYLATLNVMLGAFNSLPGLPLDGGRVLRSVLWRRSGNFRTATVRAADAGSALATGLMIFGGLQALGGNLIGGFWLVVIGLFLRSAAEGTRRATQLDESLSGTTVGDLMVREPVVVPADASVRSVAEDYFLHLGFGGFPVVDGERIAGLVSLGDVRKCPRDERERREVREIMHPVEPSLLIPPTADLSEALRRMNELGVSRLLVGDGDGHRIVGLITRSGVSRFAQTRALLEAG